MLGLRLTARLLTLYTGYAWAADEFRKTGWFSEVILRSFPDPYRAREKIWLPFLQKQCQCDANSECTSNPPLLVISGISLSQISCVPAVLIGHSSGAVAAMRLLEQTPLLGAVLVSACHTDLGDVSCCVNFCNKSFKSPHLHHTSNRISRCYRLQSAG